jgi:hypothetical protein
MTEQLPIIDMSAAIAGESGAYARLAEDVGKARPRKTAFFYASQHAAHQLSDAT